MPQSVTLHIHDDEILVIGVYHRMELLGGGVDPAEAVAIGAHPDVAVDIFCE